MLLIHEAAAPHSGRAKLLTMPNGEGVRRLRSKQFKNVGGRGSTVRETDEERLA